MRRNKTNSSRSFITGRAKEYKIVWYDRFGIMHVKYYPRYDTAWQRYKLEINTPGQYNILFATRSNNVLRFRKYAPAYHSNGL